MIAGSHYAVPLRAVDRVEVVGRDPVRLRAVKTVTASDPYMDGHFPGLTMLPAVFLLEALRQVVASTVPAGRPPELLAVLSSRLLTPMLGGDEITLDVSLEPAGPAWKVSARCTRGDGTTVARLSALVGDPDTPPPDLPAEAPEPAAGPPVLEHAAIRRLLPVRHPILLVDRVVALEPGRRIETVKNVSGSEPCFRGLTEDLPPSAYSFPRCLALESFGQSAALLWLASGDGGAGGLLMLAAIRDVRFTGSAGPGDQLRHVVRLDRTVGPNAFLDGQIWAGDRRLATVGTLIAVSRPAEGSVDPTPMAT